MNAIIRGIDWLGLNLNPDNRAHRAILHGLRSLVHRYHMRGQLRALRFRKAYAAGLAAQTKGGK